MVVRHIDWSAKSPDFNLIKHLWDRLEQMDQIPAAGFQDLAESIHGRAEAVVVTQLLYSVITHGCSIHVS